MKYYSDLLNKCFDTPENCEAEEAKYKEQLVAEAEKKERAEREAQEAKNIASKQKKQLAQKIEDADNELKTTLEEYNSVRNEVLKMREETAKKCQELLDAANEKVDAARRKKWSLIEDFNNKFGLYTVTFSGDRAKKELNVGREYLTWMSDLLSSFFR